MISLPGTPDGGAFVLSTQKVKGGSGTLCERAVRSENTAGGVNLSRGAGSLSSSCTNAELTSIAAERVAMGQLGSVGEFKVSMQAGEKNASFTLPRTVDVTRTLVFASSQLSGAGQGAGESALASGTTLGDVSAAHVLDAGTDFSSRQVFLSRDSSTSAATWTTYVVEFGP